MKIEKKTITPSIAKSMLEKNTNNRNCSTKTVLVYSNSMKKGLWKEDTFEVIKISKSGRVLDGQHRLQAVVKSNMEINFHIAYDVDDSVFDVLDTGKKRNASDVFKINNVKNSNVIPSMIQLYFSLKNNFNVRSTQLTKSNSELIFIYEENSTFWDMVGTKSLTWYHNFSKILPPQYVGGLYAFFYEISKDDATNFMDDLANGTTDNKAILILRKRLVDDKVSIRKISSDVKFALIIKTWNFYRTNKTISCLKFDPINEPFPTAI
jgi:hypothetical protein